ncbi:o-succinylbenzoate--CoA ligase [Vibrio gallicus]|uniref:o-succinylbenzoate--CoA ligase n=1 Tax=Vibrio gallicus TaxID=190897 RepID=UPI0021C270B9|nr:o-succinylbenzoate--CoA ligase [Vibrio gallicus]
MTSSSSLLAHWSATRGEADALIDTVSPLGWKQVQAKSSALQTQLIEHGFNQGDVLLIVTAHSSLEIILLYLACLELGVVCAFVPQLSSLELEHRLEVTGARAIYVCPSVKLSHSAQLALSFDNQQPTCRDSVYDTQNITSLIFTSGSTGSPKAVAHTVHNHLASATGIQHQFSFDKQSCWLLSLPMYHVSGLAIVWRWLVSGCRLQLKKDKGLDLDGVTHTSMVPTQLQRALDSNAVGTLQKVLLGGAIIPHQLATQASQCGIETWAGYGLTEMASTVTAKRVNGLDSAGYILPKRDLKLIAQRIWVKGETLAVGYWQQGRLLPLATSNGWFDTKDLGLWCDNELAIIGRADNMFISGGENIHCEEIERVLLSHPLIEQAFIVPVSDKTFGHRPMAMVSCVTTDSSDTEHLDACLKNELDQLCMQQLQRFKRPIGYGLIPKSLLSQGIKVSRKQLAEYVLKSNSF